MIKLWYWIQGVSVAPEFYSSDDPNVRIFDFQIHVKGITEARSPGSLKIWKIKSPLLLGEDGIDGQVAENIFNNLKNNCGLIGSHRFLSEAFSNMPVNHLHVVVTAVAPVNERIHRLPASTPPAIGSYWTHRKGTVDELFERLSFHSLVQVRGAPASGKTSLSALLYARILKESNVEVFYYGSYPSEQDSRYHNWRMRLQTEEGWTNHPPPNTTRYVLIHEAQSTYWDIPLWNKRSKTVQQMDSTTKVALFCSYGSPDIRPNRYPVERGACLTLGPKSRVSLKASASGIGLYLTHAEYEEFCQLAPMRRNKIILTQDLMDALYQWTAGHVGMIESLFLFIEFNHRKEMTAGSSISLTAWYQENYTYEKVGIHLQGSAAGRGLPEPSEVQREASTWRRMLQLDPVIIKDGEASDLVDSLQRCHKGGWVQSDLRSLGEIEYTFLSPIHCSHVSWLLEPIREPFPFATPLEMTVEVINHFRPSQLFGTPRQVGGRLQDRQPEVQYQNEFYRHLLDVTQGGVGISLEFASAAAATSIGRIGFFISAVKWGIECI
ncbi:hypothetical protein FRB95_011982 [Tulasnella sp. JGI-2019a]|nr:hypothetical protein FRB95_011982 [Tulasnella sp. JGI-2019a]